MLLSNYELLSSLHDLYIIKFANVNDSLIHITNTLHYKQLFTYQLIKTLRNSIFVNNIEQIKCNAFNIKAFAFFCIKLHLFS